MRPVGKASDTTSVYLIHAGVDVLNLRRANVTGDRLKQKEAFAELYCGLGWPTPRVVEQMMRSHNFYSDELVQFKLPKWSRDRVVLLGDAAWAPTPFTGQGNQLAIIGAWVLAQELSRNRNTLAFDMYEKRLRSYVKTAQCIPLWGYAPYITNGWRNPLPVLAHTTEFSHITIDFRIQIELFRKRDFDKLFIGL